MSWWRQLLGLGDPPRTAFEFSLAAYDVELHPGLQRFSGYFIRWAFDRELVRRDGEPREQLIELHAADSLEAIPPLHLGETAGRHLRASDFLPPLSTHLSAMEDWDEYFRAYFVTCGGSADAPRPWIPPATPDDWSDLTRVAQAFDQVLQEFHPPVREARGF